jgi:Leucine-rich repeat (LRR) protein
LPPTLEKLVLSNNNFTKVDRLPQSSSTLKVLQLGNNHFKEIKNLDKRFPNLESLTLRKNPIADDDEYRQKVSMMKFNNLKFLDEVPITELD